MVYSSSHEHSINVINFFQAAECYRMAAEAGHTQSVFNLALMTLKGEGGMEEDRQKGVQLLTQAAQQGLAQVTSNLYSVLCPKVLYV